MPIRRSIMVAAVAGMLAMPAYAKTVIYTDINLGPPEPRVVYTPAPRSGYVWSPGYWQMDRYGNYFWTDGYWVDQRPGYVWVPDRWDYYPTGWRFQRGYYNAGRNRQAVVEHRSVVNDYTYRDRNDRRDRGNRRNWDNNRSRDDDRGRGRDEGRQGRSR